MTRKEVEGHLKRMLGNQPKGEDFQSILVMFKSESREAGLVSGGTADLIEQLIAQMHRNDEVAAMVMAAATGYAEHIGMDFAKEVAKMINKD